MKNIFLVITAIFLASTAFAQAPNKMSYQTIVRNTGNSLVGNQAVGIRISIVQNSPTGTVVYEETHNPTTNINGLASLEIGTGTVTSGTFAAIDWAAGPYFIKTETDPNGGTNYTIAGTSELLAVPYALHATTADSIVGGIPTSPWTTLGNNIYNNNTGNIGIGTTNPSEILHLSKANSNNYLRLETGGTGYSSGIKLTKMGSIFGITMGLDANTDDLFFSHQNFVGLNSRLMTIKNTGLVGIGTSTPSSMLTLQSNTNVPQVELTNPADSSNLFLSLPTATATGGVGTGAGSKYDLVLFAGGVDHMTVERNGNVGIGTDAPVSKLEVKGDVTVHKTQPVLNIVDSSTTTSGSVSKILFDHTAASSSSVVNVGAIEYGPSAGFTLKRGNFNFLHASTNGKMGLGQSYTPPFKISAWGDVGIVSSSNSSVGSPLGYYKLGYSNGFGSVLTWAGMGSFNTGGVGSQADLRFYTTTGSTTERMRITSSGNVGIGSTNPVDKLSVQDGDISIRKAAPNNTMIGRFKMSNTNYPNSWAGLEVWQENGSDQASLSLMTAYGSSVSRMFIEETGNIGVATTNPAYKFHVNGSAGKPGGGSWTNASDRRLKDEIVPFKDGLTSILAINPVKYHYNELSGIDTKPEYVGVIAQELQEVAPYMVGSFDKDGTEYLDVDNSAMTYMLINAVKEQQKTIEGLKKELTEIETLKAENAALKASLQRIEAHLGLDSNSKK